MGLMLICPIFPVPRMLVEMIGNHGLPAFIHMNVFDCLFAWLVQLPQEARRFAEEHRYDMEVPKLGRVQAFELLNGQLIANAILYESEELQEKRDAVAGSMLAVCAYLNRRGLGAATLRRGCSDLPPY